MPAATASIFLFIVDCIPGQTRVRLQRRQSYLWVFRCGMSCPKYYAEVKFR